MERDSRRTQQSALKASSKLEFNRVVAIRDAALLIGDC